MPGKWDSHTRATEGGLGQYFPGGKEAQAWDEGWRYRYSGPAVSVPITNNPYLGTERTVEKLAWDNGWNEADANTAGEQRGPATEGPPPA